MKHCLISCVVYDWSWTRFSHDEGWWWVRLQWEKHMTTSFLMVTSELSVSSLQLKLQQTMVSFHPRCVQQLSSVRLCSRSFSHHFLFFFKRARCSGVTYRLEAKTALPLFKETFVRRRPVQNMPKTHARTHARKHKQADSHKQALFSHGFCTHATFHLVVSQSGSTAQCVEQRRLCWCSISLFFLHPVCLMRRHLQRHYRPTEALEGISQLEVTCKDFRLAAWRRRPSQALLPLDDGLLETWCCFCQDEFQNMYSLIFFQPSATCYHRDESWTVMNRRWIRLKMYQTLEVRQWWYRTNVVSFYVVSITPGIAQNLNSAIKNCAISQRPSHMAKKYWGSQVVFQMCRHWDISQKCHGSVFFRIRASSILTYGIPWSVHFKWSLFVCLLWSKFWNK